MITRRPLHSSILQSHSVRKKTKNRAKIKRIEKPRVLTHPCMLPAIDAILFIRKDAGRRAHPRLLSHYEQVSFSSPDHHVLHLASFLSTRTANCKGRKRQSNKRQFGRQ